MADIDAPLSWRMQQDGYLTQINQLRDENAKLRDENERLQSVVSDGADNARELRDENAKLRKLCADLRFCRRHDCLTCSHGRFCDMGFDERCAKLDVEVPDE